MSVQGRMTFTVRWKATKDSQWIAYEDLNVEEAIMAADEAASYEGAKFEIIEVVHTTKEISREDLQSRL
jgi:hypothetical protein